LFGKKNRNNYSVGLDIGSKSIKLVELKKEDGNFRLAAVGVKDLPEGVISGGIIKEKDTFIGTVTQLINQCDPEIVDVVISLGTTGVLSDKIKFNFENFDNIDETILWEASQRSPFDVEDITISYKILHKDEDEKTMLVLLVAAKNSNMQICIDALYEAGLRPTIIDVSSYALNNCYALESALDDMPETVVLLDIGHQGSRILFIKDGVYHSARDISIGGENITKTLQKQLKIDYGHATSIMLGHKVESVSLDAIQSSLQFSFEEFASSFDMAVSYYSKESGDSSLEKIIVCGGGCYIPGLVNFLSAHLGVEVTASNPFSFLKYDPKLFNNMDTSNFAAILSVATGLALRGF